MANKALFQSSSPALPAVETVNAAGGPAYRLEARAALAQYAVTGCLNATFYASAEMQLDAVLGLAGRVPPEFLAKTAVYARERGLLKDMPALLVAVLSVLDPPLCERVFDRVIDDGKMLRNFVQIVRSGAVGRRSLASFPKRLVRRWLAARSDEQIFAASVGTSPSLGDVVKMAHPRPNDPRRAALYAYLIDRPYDVAALPEVVREFEDYKRARCEVERDDGWRARLVGLLGGKPKANPIELPKVPFAMLTALPLSERDWRQIAVEATWTQKRMNLNTFARHGVFASPEATRRVVAHLRDASEVRRARVLPYQLMITFLALDGGVPREVRQALEEAMEVALENVPALPGKIYVCPDVSGSMSSPVTGHRAGATTAARCIDVAALVAAALLRRADAEVLPFAEQVSDVQLDLRASVLVNATRLAAIGGGGTNCAAPLEALNRRGAKGDAVVFVSDNESWIGVRPRGTAMLAEWRTFRRRNPGAKLFCIDIAPNTTTQVPEGEDVVNVGGFSDAVFELLDAFVARREPRSWVDVIEAVSIA